MEISSVRLAGIQAYSRSTQKNTVSTKQSEESSLDADELILTSAELRELTTYTPDQTASDTSSTDAASSSGIDIADMLDSYREAIREQVRNLFSTLFGSNEDTTENTLLQTSGTGSAEPLTLDSYYSAEDTASRIVNFALSFYSGGDRDEYASMVKDAVSKGYGQAAHAFGGDLPSVAEKTIMLVMESIDQFATEESA